MAFNTEIGDVFSVKINEHYKKYFQYVINDVTQLNSDVIRAFEDSYPIDSNPDNLSTIINGKVDFYAHCITKLGLKMKLWEKVGNMKEVGNINQIMFRDTNDYGSKIGEQPVRVSHNWYVWCVNDENFTQVGKLLGENQRANIGIVINPLGIIELLKGNKYPANYPNIR